MPAPSACKHKVSDSISLPSRGSFHLSLTVLFAIGHRVVFSLGGWAPLFHTAFHVHGTTLVLLALLLFSPTGLLPCFAVLSGTIRLTPAVAYCSPQPLARRLGLGSSPFARRYLENRCFFLFLRVLRCFSSPRFPRSPYFIQVTVPAHYHG